MAHLNASAEARRVLNAGIRLGGKDLSPESHFQIATAVNILGDTQPALEQLSLAIHGGFRDYTRFKIDPDLTSLQGNPAFLHLLESVPTHMRPQPVRRD